MNKLGANMQCIASAEERYLQQQQEKKEVKGVAARVVDGDAIDHQRIVVEAGDHRRSGGAPDSVVALNHVIALVGD